MYVLKCKMCGGNVMPIEGQHYGTCDSCGNTMTLPDANEEKMVNLFNRANHYRLQSEFDKALATYETILSEMPNNAEAHWGCVISKFGVEYVEDPKTHKHLPTLHRVQKESVLVDLEYKAAIEFADSTAKKMYEEEAQQIDAIQKRILSVAVNEAPYDIFICYKETDEYGKRTMDSVLAQDIYQQLCSEGYRVFFSRITLEGKIGVEYEPYIFSALNSAKVMLVIGTKPDYFNAVWVKNEWARFLSLTKQDSSRILIPCYRDMDAYELPEALAIFQSQDMSKIGFLQDLKHGISKIMAKDEPVVKTVVTSGVDASVAPMLKRAFLLLEDAEWEESDILLERVLNQDPENPMAYIGKLMIEAKVSKEEYLAKRPVELDKSTNYQKAIRFGDEAIRKKLNDYCTLAKEQLDNLISKREEEELRKQKENEELALRQKLISDYLHTVREPNKFKWMLVIAILSLVSMPIMYWVFITDDVWVILAGCFGGELAIIALWGLINTHKGLKPKKQQLIDHNIPIPEVITFKQIWKAFWNECRKNSK